MYQKLLDKFFKQYEGITNKIPSAAALAHFQIVLMRDPEASQALQGLMNDVVYKDQPDREEKVLSEKAEVESATCEQIIRIMRRGVDPIIQDALVSRALSFEDELIPEVLRMFKTSLNTYFIEAASRVLSLCGKDIADELVNYFDDIRNPYAKCMALVVLGFKANNTLIPWLIEKHDELKRLYPDEEYHDGAYYALYEIEGRFYPVGKK